MNEDHLHINFDKAQFKIPEGYFEDLQDAIKKSTLLEIEEDSFLVPSAYFESFAEEVRSKIDDSDISIPRLNLMKYTSYAVAAGLALFLFFQFYSLQDECEDFTCMLENSELVEDDIAWIEPELVEAYYSEILQAEKVQEDDALIEYILENDWDVEYLIEQE